MISWRRSLTLIGSGFLAIALCLSGLFVESAIGQKKPPIPQQLVPDGSSAGYSSVKFIENDGVRVAINVARDCIKNEDWKEAIQVLQGVLNMKKAYHVKVIERDPANPKK